MGQRLSEFDIHRAIACLSVIIVHITAGLIFLGTTGMPMKIVFSLINRSLKFTTPTFIFISGMILFYVYRDRKINYFQFLAKRLSVILIPYLLWTIFYYWLFIKTGAYTFSLEFFINKLFFADMVYHLYFILIIVQFYFLFGLFKFLFKTYNSHFLIIFFLLANLLFMNNIYFKYVDRFFMQYIFFFALGNYFAVNYQALKAKLVAYRYLIAAGYILAAASYGFQFIYMSVYNKPLLSGHNVNNLWFFFSAISIIFYLSIAIKIEESSHDKLKRFFYQISDASYYIYLSHPFILMLAEKIIGYLNIVSASQSFVMIVLIVFGLTIPISVLYKQKKPKHMLSIFLS